MPEVASVALQIRNWQSKRERRYRSFDCFVTSHVFEFGLFCDERGWRGLWLSIAESERGWRLTSNGGLWVFSGC